MCISLRSAGPWVLTVTGCCASPVDSCLVPAVRIKLRAMLPPKLLSATKSQKSRGPDLYELDSALTKEPDATIGEGTTDSEFSHQRFRNLLYVELVGPRKTLIQLRNLCLNWLQPEIRTKEEIIELLVLEQYLTIVPERIKPWVQAKKPENCEKLVTLLENYKEMYEPKDDDVQSDDDRSRVGAESPSPRSVHSFCSDWDWRGRSRETQFRDHWPYTRTSRKRLLQHDLSLPLMEKTNFEMEGEDDIDRDSMMDFESTSQDAESYQDVVDLTEDRKPQDPVQDNMENYRKLLSLGVQLAEDDRHSHLTHGHSSRSKRSAYPSTSRGLKTMPEAKKSTHRRGICEDRSSHGVIMEKFIKDVSRNSKVGRARESNDWPQRFPRMLDDDWKDVSFSKRESKSHSAAELSKPKVIAESTISSADAIQCQTAHAGESAYEGKVCGRSVIQSIVTAEPPRHHTGNELAECSNGESSIYISDFNRQQKIDARENPFEVAKYNKYTVIHSVSSAEPQNSPTVEGPSELKKDGESSAPNSHVREYQKARAKKKYIECCRDYKTSVIHSLPFGEPQNSHTNERFYKCQECGESFVHSSDLSKHQKIHDREKPSGSKMYERSVIRSLALTDPQTSYAEDCMRMQCKECGKYFATSEALGRHQKVYGRERFHGRTPFGSSVIRGVGFDESQKDESDDTIYECKDCGLGFAHFNEFEDHQKVHGREYLMDNRVCGPSVIQTCSFGDSHKSGAGDQLYECPQCGESFISNDFLFEHQKMHEMEPFFVGRQHNEAWMRRLPLPTIRKRRRSSKKSPPVSKTLRCQVCGQDFIHSSVLREHMKIHTGEDQLERGKTSEDTGAPGLALTEFQRSQAEEKNYECKTCGETFLSQPDLRDHMRVHEKDEPFNYGATFVHTSFVSELPNTSSPFYECKDCGKSFIHSTILVKHQQLHLEEAAQEVEANFVVPQEVLRIQGSNVEAAEPEVEAAEPEVEAAEPNLEAAEPNGEAEGPDGGAVGPDGEAEQPSGVAEPPRGDADEPDGAGIEDPEERAEDPEEDADEPDGAGIEDPEEEGGDQEIQVEEPYYDCRECAKTFTSSSAYGEHLKTHARVIIYEAGNVYGESSRYTEHASTSTSASDRADEKYFKCDVCGQLFRDRLSLARHQNSHTG
ncbi:paternally-expressed gene 3 protein isoform X4 [Elephas maximus indicus]|uniref:paternally-expressed gene 3 protein isoform X4 n=1 Tax=Elephas maximus indicus TaxID=99487 RepID=UPI002116231F|nr:paternally-expressed gene 3 protein isoform X4 [Elephas maximus indicus]